MARVFLDVGAHVGETLAAAVEQRWGFDRIHCFEPAPQCWAALERLGDDRVEVHRFGLWSSDATLALHDPGEIGASLLSGKQLGDTTEQVQVRDAAAWFRDHLSADDEVVMKVNCEGAECELLDHLVTAGELAKVNELAVHFDVRKIPAKAHQEATTRTMLRDAGISYRPAEQIFFGRNATEKTSNWLAWYFSSGIRRLRYSVLRRAEFAVRVWVFQARHRAASRVR